VSGVIEAINEELNGQPGLLNKSPEDKGIYDCDFVFAAVELIIPLRPIGWLCKIKLSDTAEVGPSLFFTVTMCI
jgi:glycine cleavage system H lipoate-binding protein